MNDDVLPYYDSMNNEERLNEFVHFAKTFTKQEWWSKELAATFLVDLVEIANADGKVVELEKEWIISTANIFGINSPDVVDKQKNESLSTEETESTLQKQLADQFVSLYSDCVVQK